MGVSFLIIKWSTYENHSASICWKKMEEVNKKKLYVGNLSYSTTDESLKEAFAKAGEVAEARVITDKMSGRSKGFGFVEFGSEADAQKGIEMWDGKELDGRPIKVNLARPMSERPARPELS